MFEIIKNARKSNLKVVDAVQVHYYFCNCPKCDVEELVEAGDLRNQKMKNGVVVKCNKCGEKFIMKTEW